MSIAGWGKYCLKSNFLQTATAVNQHLTGEFCPAHFVNIYGHHDTSVGKEIVLAGPVLMSTLLSVVNFDPDTVDTIDAS